MTKIHMELQAVEDLANRLLAFSTSTNEAARQLEDASRRLFWIGSQRDEFVTHLFAITNVITRNCEDLSALSKLVTREMEEWLAVDRGFGDVLQLVGAQRTDPGPYAPLFDWMYSHFRPELEAGARMFFGVDPSTANTSEELRNQILQKSDQRVMALLASIFTYPASDNTEESLSFTLAAGATIPGVVNPKLGLKPKITITRTNEGCYRVKISQDASAALVGEVAGPGASLHAGSIGAAAETGEAKVEVGLDVETYIVYEFDPKKPGDMTLMWSFLASMGIGMFSATPSTVSPCLPGLKEHLVEVHYGAGGTILAGVEAPKLGLENLPASGAGFELGAKAGITQERVVEDHWVTAYPVSISAEASRSLRGFGKDTTVEAELAGCVDHATQEVSTKLSLELAKKGTFGFENLEKLLPPNAIAALSNRHLSDIGASAEAYQELKLECKFHEPPEEVMQHLFKNGELDYEYLHEHASITVKETTGLEVGGEFKAGGHALTSEAKLSGSISGQHEIERKIGEWTGRAYAAG